jgi:hypothetical protein
VAKIAAALSHARRRNTRERALHIQQLLRANHLRQTPAVQATYAAVVTAHVRLVVALNEQIDALAVVVEQHFGRHPDADIFASCPTASSASSTAASNTTSSTTNRPPGATTKPPQLDI